MSLNTIPEASGASIRPGQLAKSALFPITDFGAGTDQSPAANTDAINSAILAAAAKGGTVLVPPGVFYTYTILLQSNVNLCLSEGAVIAAARTDISGPYEPQIGEGGNYAEPEVNPCIGLQDHGHSYFANSLVYGADLENIMICGKGLFTGGRFDPESGVLEYVLKGHDPAEPENRLSRGHRGNWFGNKCLALVRCKNVVLEDFSVTIGGHFAIIAEGCENLYANGLLLDTTRDAFDIDCCQDVTVVHTTCNSLTDDGLCLKASFGAGIFKPLENILIEDCVVSGYDAGSVYAGTYTRDKLIATDRCGPTGRVKFGTESTCGGRLVTIRRVTFDRSRGFALEAVDGSPLSDVIFEDCLLDNVSSSPIFLRAGDRGRFPVTGNSSSAGYPADETNVRLDNRSWVLPDAPGFQRFPAKRYSPSYNRTKTVTVDGCSFFDIVDPDDPVRRNPANCGGQPLCANACGYGSLAGVSNIRISNIRITNADPRYPILLMGLTDSHLRNIVLENISVEYRGGLTMEHATEQRQLNTDWKYSQFHAKEQVQNLPWLVNSFFLKNEGLLPRVDWDREEGCWKDDPYNVPELPEVYPEPSNWGILPAYGIYARHADGLLLKNIRITCKVPDGRHVCVFDDVNGARLEDFAADCAGDIAPIAVVTDHYRRHTNAENVPEQPYFTTTVTGLEIADQLLIHRLPSPRTDLGTQPAPEEPRRPDAAYPPGAFLSQEEPRAESGTSPALTAHIQIHAPAPGTPRDSLYDFPTVPCPETGYRFSRDTDSYPLPLTVHRPFFQPVTPVSIPAGQPLRLALTVRNPATDISDRADSGMVYNERLARLHHSVTGADVTMSLSCENPPEGASLDPVKREFYWTPSPAQQGEYDVIFTADDGVIPEKLTVHIAVI